MWSCVPGQVHDVADFAGERADNCISWLGKRYPIRIGDLFCFSRCLVAVGKAGHVLNSPPKGLVLRSRTLIQPYEVFDRDVAEFEIGGAAAVHQTKGDPFAVMGYVEDLVGGRRVFALD